MSTGNLKKMAITETAFKELELYAEGYKNKDISRIIGCTCNSIRIKDSFFRILNFGYEGMIPEGIVPKFEPEDLCRRVDDRANYPDYTFRYYSPVSKEELLADSFVCGGRNNIGTVSLDCDIRKLDLSVRTFNSLMRGFRDLQPAGVPFTIRYLTQMSEQDLMKIRNLGIGGIAEIKEELAQNGFELEQDKPSLNDVIAGAAKRATTGAHGDEPFSNVKERLPQGRD